VRSGCSGGAKVLDGFPGVLSGTEKHAVGSLGLAHGELIERNALTSSSKNAGTGALGEAERAHLEGLEFQKTHIIRDRGDNNSDLVLLVSHVARETRDRHGGSVRLAQVKSAEHDFVEFGVRPPGKKPVELHEKLEVHVIRLGSFAPLVTDIAASSNKIDTLKKEKRVSDLKIEYGKRKALRRPDPMHQPRAKK